MEEREREGGGLFFLNCSFLFLVLTVVLINRYAGIFETASYFVLYERLKGALLSDEQSQTHRSALCFVAAGIAKFSACAVWYPHGELIGGKKEKERPPIHLLLFIYLFIFFIFCFFALLSRSLAKRCCGPGYGKPRRRQAGRTATAV
jgi:hypothetical protein